MAFHFDPIPEFPRFTEEMAREIWSDDSILGFYMSEVHSDGTVAENLYYLDIIDPDTVDVNHQISVLMKLGCFGPEDDPSDPHVQVTTIINSMAMVRRYIHDKSNADRSNSQHAAVLRNIFPNLMVIMARIEVMSDQPAIVITDTAVLTRDNRSVN